MRSLFLLGLLAACTPTDDTKGDDSAADDTGVTTDDSAADDSAVDDSGAADDTGSADDTGASDDTGSADDSASDDSGATDDTSTADRSALYLAAVQAWFNADHSAGPRTRDAGLPEGQLLEADGADRADLPADLLVSFDWFNAAEVEVRVDLGTIDELEVYTVTTTTDGDDAFVEAYTAEGRYITGARFHAAEPPVWDSFEGRSRLVSRFTTGEDVTWEEGLSEADERAAEGQTPIGWTGDVQVLSGSIPQVGSLMGAVDFDGLALTDAQRDVAVAAFDYLWGVHLQYTVNAGQIVLGPSNQGVLTVGAFTRSTTGESYVAADWRDIDDGSFVLYFDANGVEPRVQIIQYDN